MVSPNKTVPMANLLFTRPAFPVFFPIVDDSYNLSNMEFTTNFRIKENIVRKTARTGDAILWFACEKFSIHARPARLLRPKLSHSERRPVSCRGT